MKLIHYARAALPELLDVEQEPRSDGMKPAGLWVSVEGKRDWKEWCEAESFHLDSWKVEQEIVLQDNVLQPLIGGDTGGIVHLYSPLCLDEFTRIYKAEFPRYAGMRSELIDWTKVADDFDGIIISPYIYERRMSLFWYYGWDCASGCIWRPSNVVASVGLPLPVTFRTMEDADG